MLLLILLLSLTLPGIALAADAQPSPGDIHPSAVLRHVPGMPERGQTMEAMRARLGDPRQVRGPVGEPPITRWV